jgi:signal peptidase II
MLVLLLGFLIAAADQATKYVVRLNFAVGETHPVINGFFSFTYVRNTGAAWGILGGQNTWLTVLSVVMLIVIVVFRRSFLSSAWEHRVALGLLIGGIVGNLIDRLRLGWVTDFLHFYWRDYHWPAFNIADSAICVGVGIYILSSLWIASHPLHESQLGKPSGAGPADSPKAADAAKP